MPVDADLCVRDGSSDLTATATSSAIDLGAAPPQKAWCFEVMVPSAGGTSPTLDITIKECATSGGTYVTFHTIAQITAAGLYAHYFANKQRYIKVTFTLGGTSPDFGAVTAYIKDDSLMATVR